MSQRLASRRSRLGAALIDIFAVLVALTPGGLALIRATDRYGHEGMGTALVLLAMGMIGVLGVQFYLLVQKGQTVGKKSMGIRIVDASDGTWVGAGRVVGVRSVIPTLVAMVPYVGWLLAIGDVLCLFGGKRRCIHDYMAGTIVVTEAPSRAASTGAQDSSAGAHAPSTSAETPSNGADPTSGRGAPRRSSSEPSASSSSAQRPSVPVPPRHGLRSRRGNRTKVQSQVLPKLTATRDMKVTMKELNRLRENGRLTDHEHRERRQQVLTIIVTEAEAGPNEVLRGVLRLQGNGLLDVEDVRVVAEILNALYPGFLWKI